LYTDSSALSWPRFSFRSGTGARDDARTTDRLDAGRDGRRLFQRQLPAPRQTLTFAHRQLFLQ
jgi:hypothetical protein